MEAPHGTRSLLSLILWALLLVALLVAFYVRSRQEATAPHPDPGASRRGGPNIDAFTALM
jgi:hypothetical protein